MLFFLNNQLKQNYYVPLQVNTIIEMKNILLVILIITCNNIFAQQDSIAPQQETPKQVNYTHVALVGTIIPITIAGVYIYLNNVWWKEQRVPFHITDDLELRYALNLDKAGHFISSYFVSEIFSDVLQVTGLPKKQSVWGGAALSIINSTIVEVKDAYSPYWGFSKFDMLANISGALLPVLQYHIQAIKYLHFSWSYDFSHPSYYKSLPGHEDKSFIDDYERHNFWCTYDIWNALRLQNKESYTPFFIQPAVGLSAQNLDGKGAGEHEWFIGMHINLMNLYRGSSKFIQYTCKYINFYHLPAPAIKIQPEITAYPITY